MALYTDGITESFNAAEEEFGEQRLCDALRRHRKLSSSDLLAAIVSEVQSFSPAEQYDDMTLIVAKCKRLRLEIPAPCGEISRSGCPTLFRVLAKRAGYGNHGLFDYALIFDTRPENRSPLSWFYESPIVSELGSCLQITGDLDRKCLLCRQAIQTVDGQPYVKVAGPSVSVGRLRAIRAGAVPKIPVILNCRNSIGRGLRRENDRFTSTPPTRAP